jgi:uncharacterized protein
MAYPSAFSENNARSRGGILCLLLLGLLAVFAAAPTFAAVKFPELSGRVVDAANILQSSTVDKLTGELKNLEDKTTNQLVVVTLPSLEGLTIEDYGVQLGRAWKIGQKGKDNGVLLIVAPEEHKVRIEVGYGLEGTITDAQSSIIIHDMVLPAFRAGNMEQGIIDGTESLILLMGGDVPADSAAVANADDPATDKLVAEILTVLMLGGIFYGLYCGVTQSVKGGGSGGSYSSGYSSGSSYSSSSSSESYSGGGGSFGGGGASGGW